MSHSPTLFDAGSALLGEPCQTPPAVAALIAQLATARIGATFNQFASDAPDGEGCRDRLRRYLAWRWHHADVVLVGEAAGYKGALLSGIAFTSIRQLGIGQTSEQSATIVHRVLVAHAAERRVILWNTVPTHPFVSGLPGASNRGPTKEEVAIGRELLEPICAGRTVVAVGKVAQAAIGGQVPSVRHPARGGAAAFEAGVGEIFSSVLGGRSCLTA